MNRMFYYAKLNSDNVCIGFVSYPTLIKNVEGLVNIAEYNESYLYKKHSNGNWSQETFEPSIPLELQQQLEDLQKAVSEQNHTIAIMQQNESNLIATINQLDGTIMELTTLIALLQPQGGM